MVDHFNDSRCNDSLYRSYLGYGEYKGPFIHFLKFGLPISFFLPPGRMIKHIQFIPEVKR